jgi:hypothetical protein
MSKRLPEGTHAGQQSIDSWGDSCGRAKDRELVGKRPEPTLEENVMEAAEANHVGEVASMLRCVGPRDDVTRNEKTGIGNVADGTSRTVVQKRKSTNTVLTTALPDIREFAISLHAAAVRLRGTAAITSRWASTNRLRNRLRRRGVFKGPEDQFCRERQLTRRGYLKNRREALPPALA